jgi:hypothetical protein
MRTTDFCFSLPDYEYPRFVSYQHLFEAYASPLADGLAPTGCFRNRRPTRLVDLAFHDAESASARSPGLSRGIFSRRSRSTRTSDTPVASDSPARRIAWDPRPGCRGCFLRRSVKRRRSLQPEVPSIVESLRFYPSGAFGIATRETHHAHA